MEMRMRGEGGAKVGTGLRVKMRVKEGTRVGARVGANVHSSRARVPLGVYSRPSLLAARRAAHSSAIGST